MEAQHRSEQQQYGRRDMVHAATRPPSSPEHDRVKKVVDAHGDGPQSLCTGI